MWTQTKPPRNTQQPPPPPPPSSTISEEGAESCTRRLHTAGTGNTIGSALSMVAQPADADLLAELLGSLEKPVVTIGGDVSAASHTDAVVANTAGDLATLGGPITTQAVLDGLRSLDEFERQAAVHTEGTDTDHIDQHHYHRGFMADLENEHLSDSLFRAVAAAGGTSSSLHAISVSSHTPASAPVGLGSFNEAELSAALEQIYWGSLDIPMAATPADASSALPTPPSSAPIALHTNTPVHSHRNITATTADESDEKEEYEEDDDDEDEDDNPLELEELSLFSLFLSDMAAFEGFLDSLSLNQLRQCAATVNSVLVRRESGIQQQTIASNKKKRHRAGKSVDISPEPATAASPTVLPTAEQTRSSDTELSALSQPTLALLREWLPPSTADCVITALQSADLPRFESSANVQGSSSERVDDQTAGVVVSASSSNNNSNNGAAEPRSSAVDAANNSTADDASGADNTNDPLVETDSNGTPWLGFVYAQKGKPQRYRIRIDIDRAPATAIPSSFKQNNCVYPRANCTRANYRGNRWNYETECNALGWKLAFLNQEQLSARRGLLQTAVNNYRTMVAGRKSRRITRMEKAERTQASGSSASVGTSSSAKKRPLSLDEPSLERADITESASDKRPKPNSAPKTPLSPAPSSPLPSQASQSAKCLTLSAYVNGKFSRIRINVDIGSMGDAAVDTRFKRDHAVFPRALDAPRTRYGVLLQGRWEFEHTCNELAWRLAWLNKTRLRGRKLLVQRCIDAYRARFAAPPWPLLSCHTQLMGGSVDHRFFDYWRPRPGSRSLTQSASPEKAAALVSVSVPASIPSSPSSSETGSAARVRAIRPRSSAPATVAAAPNKARAVPASPLPPLNSPGLQQKQQQPTPQKKLPTALPKPVRPRPVARPQPCSPPPAPCRPEPATAPTTPSRPMTAQPQPPLRSPGVRPPPTKAIQRTVSASVAAAAPAAPAAPAATISTPKPRENAPAAVSKVIRPNLPPPSANAGPRPATATPHRPPAPASIKSSPTHHPRPAAALGKRASEKLIQNQSGSVLPPPQTPGQKAPAKAAPQSPKPLALVSIPQVHPAAAKPVPRTPAITSSSGAKNSNLSAKSAKAQAAANMLTDVLRQLSKSDPSLETLTGMLEKKNAPSANRIAGEASNAVAQNVRLGGRGAGIDDHVPLDAKVAELEKLIIDLQKE
ncbi:hypothetical protein LPJ74_002875 [Coemansia sp. RSA 1843]|nr:hypothetical protein LPJ74_002875 [Coemansia sp. RSA 1843]